MCVGGAKGSIITAIYGRILKAVNSGVTARLRISKTENDKVNLFSERVFPLQRQQNRALGQDSNFESPKNRSTHILIGVANKSEAL